MGFICYCIIKIMNIRWSFVTDDNWDTAVQELYSQLDAVADPTQFPAHFVQSAFPKIGGRLLRFERDGVLLASGLLFPRDVVGGERGYTLRLQRHAPGFELNAALLSQPALSVVPYDPALPQRYTPARMDAGAYSIGTPDAGEAQQVRDLQALIWQSGPSGLYPADLHAPAFRPGSSLVARRNGAVQAFLFGFYRFGTLRELETAGLPYRYDLCIESQLLGIVPAARRSGLATRLKQAQAQQAQAAGIDIIHWTADPLQFGNAVLNFNRLRALAFCWLPDHYPFRNALNRAPASRLALSWLLPSQRVRRGSPVPHLADCRILNAGPRRIAEADGAPYLAIEIPADWTGMQRDQPETALAWRRLSDEIFAEYLGLRERAYVITDAMADARSCYLIASMYKEQLLL